jgi:hypothetical protein
MIYVQQISFKKRIFNKAAEFTLDKEVLRILLIHAYCFLLLFRLTF